MDFARLEYIKNVNDEIGWAYNDNPRGAYFRLNFKSGDGDKVKDLVKAHALNLPKGSLIILSQRPPKSERYLTHVVELVNEGSEDEPQWEQGPWGIFRWVKIHWIADFSQPDHLPLDQEVMRVNWGYFDTKAKLLTSPGLMKQWITIDNLRTHLKEVFI